MFSEFENMFKKQADKITKAMPLDLLDGYTTSLDYSKTPQKFNINGRSIEEKKLMAEGAFGFIWLAEDVNTKQQFALKRVICMTEDKVKSALLEKNLMEKMPESPYIVKYYGGTVFKHDDNTVIVTLMELCPGGNLFDMLEKREGKGIVEDTVKRIASSVLHGLSALHKAGFIHRDIKIENILIGKDNNMKICDFGSCTTEVVDFAKIPKSEYDHVKEGIEAFTTPMYRPPEVVDPYLKYKVTGKADLWMLGCVLYTMSYFIHPFIEANAVGIAGAVYKFPKYPQETKYKVSPKMQDFIRNLLTPNPQFRPSPQKMIQILDRWDDFTSIPLNQEAKRLKKEQEQREEELKKLNKKVLSYDGDIPMEELMKLQNKLKNNNQEHYQKEKITFINDRQTEKISHGVSAIQKASSISSNSSGMGIHAASSIQGKKTTVTATKNTLTKPSSSQNIDVWSDSFVKNTNVPAKKDANANFDAFNDAFSNPTTVSKPTSVKPAANNNFFEFFAESSSPATIPVPVQSPGPNAVNNNKAKEVNLLDL